MDYSILLLVGIACIIGGIVWGKNQRDGWSILAIWFIFTPIATTAILTVLYAILYGFSWGMLFFLIPLLVPVGIWIFQTVEDVRYKKIYDAHVPGLKESIFKLLPEKNDIEMGFVFKNAEGSSPILSVNPSDLVAVVRIYPNELHAKDALYVSEKVLRKNISDMVCKTFKKADVYIDFGYQYLDEKRKQSM